MLSRAREQLLHPGRIGRQSRRPAQALDLIAQGQGLQGQFTALGLRLCLQDPAARRLELPKKGPYVSLELGALGHQVPREAADPDDPQGLAMKCM